MPEHQTLTGKTAAITGASSGIGAVTARRLAREGMNVALGARSGDDLRSLAKELEDEGVEALPVELDVRSWESTSGFADAVSDAFDGCDLCFANAGTGGHGRLQDLSVEQWNKTLETNLTGAFHTAKAFAPMLTEAPAWSTLVFTASVSGTMGMAGASAYCASKWGLRGLAQSIAEELAAEGVRVTTINPGYVNTPWHEGNPRTGEMVQPEDLADLVVYLATMPSTAMVDDVTVWPARLYSG